MSNEEKLFYGIGEVAEIVAVKPYVLRYWESEFKKLNPQKSFTGQRTYRPKDIQVALTIKKLLYDDKYTIAGAIQKLAELETQGQLAAFGTAEATPAPIAAVQPVEQPAANVEPTAQWQGLSVPSAVVQPTAPEPVAEPVVIETPVASEPVAETPQETKPKLDGKKVNDLKSLLEATKKVLKKYNLQ